MAEPKRPHQKRWIFVIFVIFFFQRKHGSQAPLSFRKLHEFFGNLHLSRIVNRILSRQACSQSDRQRTFIFTRIFYCQICGILIKRPEKVLDCTAEIKKVFQSGHMHGVHENACLTCLFIARNSPLVWAGRHKDISKHKLRPAKSWVARLISKRRQCSAEAKDPILVITLPPAPTSPSPPKDSQTLMLCQALWTSVSLSSYPCYVSAPFSRLALYQEASQSHATCHISNILLYS